MVGSVANVDVVVAIGFALLVALFSRARVGLRPTIHPMRLVHHLLGVATDEAKHGVDVGVLHEGDELRVDALDAEVVEILLRIFLAPTAREELVAEGVRGVGRLHNLLRRHVHDLAKVLREVFLQVSNTLLRLHLREQLHCLRRRNHDLHVHTIDLGRRHLLLSERVYS